MINEAGQRSKVTKANSFNKIVVRLKNKIPYIRLLYASILLNIAAIIFLFIFHANLPPEIPLFYGFPEGESQLAQKGRIFIPSLISITTVITNSSIAYFAKDDFVKKTLVIAGLAITFLSIVTTTKVAFLVGSY